MKKIIFILSLVLTTSLYSQMPPISQNIVWEQVGLEVESGKQVYFLKLVDQFYSSIDIPDGVSVSLDALWFKSEGMKTTHYLSFSGPIEGVSKLKELRKGSDYDIYNEETDKFSKITSITSGSTIERMNVDKANYPISQMWQWSVEDPETFLNEFYKLIKGFPQEGYLSIGLISQGASSSGETHYVYTTHKDYKSAMSWGPKITEQQQAFMNFQKKSNPSSDYLGTTTLYSVKALN